MFNVMVYKAFTRSKVREIPECIVPCDTLVEAKECQQLLRAADRKGHFKFHTVRLSNFDATLRYIRENQ